MARLEEAAEKGHAVSTQGDMTGVSVRGHEDRSGPTPYTVYKCYYKGTLCVAKRYSEFAKLHKDVSQQTSMTRRVTGLWLDTFFFVSQEVVSCDHKLPYGQDRTGTLTLSMTHVCIRNSRPPFFPCACSCKTGSDGTRFRPFQRS